MNPIAFAAIAILFLITSVALSWRTFAFLGNGKQTSGGGNSALSARASDGAVLSSLQYDGIEIADFVPNEFKGTKQTVNYRDTAVHRVELASGTTKIPTVTATADGGATVSVTQASELPGTAVVTVEQDGVTNYYQVAFTVATIPTDAVYQDDFNDPDKALHWNAYVNGKPDTALTDLSSSLEDGRLKLKAGNTGNNYIFDDDSNFTDGFRLYHMKIRLTELGETARFGLQLFGKTSNDHATLNYDSGKFVWHIHKNGVAKNPAAALTYSLKENAVYDIEVQIDSSNNLLLRINHKTVWKTQIASGDMPTTDGDFKFGIKLWNTPYTVYIDDVYVANGYEDVIPDFVQEKEDSAPQSGSYEEIASDDMKVYVGNDFPFVYRYLSASNTFLANGIDPKDAPYLKKMVINDVGVDVDSTRIDKTANSITYQLRAQDLKKDIDSVFTVKLSVKSGKKLRMEFTDIVENGDTVVRSFYLPGHSMISMRGDDVQAAIGSFPGWGPMQDTLLNMTDVTSSTQYSVTSYIMLNDNAISATINNNVLDGNRKYMFDAYVSEEPVQANSYLRRFSVTNTAWLWHYYGNKNTAVLSEYQTPYAEVALGGDENTNGTIDWQDAGLLYRDIMKMPYGSEDVKNYWSYIAMNMSSMAGNPSLRILDRAKAISYLTDGFGQKIMNKGYQVGGHDDSHGDYDNVSVQQGGVKDFEYLNTVGELYNLKTGVHINATEFALDGFETRLDEMRGYSANGTTTLLKNWNWLDQAYLVDKDKFVQSGHMEQDIKSLRSTLPGLDWVYIDVWQSGSTYAAKAMAQYLKESNFVLMTEAAADFTEDATQYHWNTDLYYPSGGTQSKVVRFIQNDIADKFAPDKALLSMTMPGVAGWRNTTMFSDAEGVFYRNNLAAKYMQHFELQSWVTDTSATFSGGVTSEVNGNLMSLKKDGKLLAKIDVTKLDYSNVATPQKTGKAEIFIPWSPETEEKIYYFNDNNASSTWDLPASWDAVTKVYQYKLTAGGREYIGELTPTADHKLAVSGDLSTPYILTKERQETGGLSTNRLPASQDKWGEGSEILNFGFTGGTFENWSKTGSDVQIVKDMIINKPGTATLSYNSYGDPLVQFVSEGELNQTLTVEENATYTISAWLYTENRKATLQITVGDKVYSKSLENTDIDISMRPSKYMNARFQRLDVDVPVPAGTTQIQLTYKVEGGSGISVVDDFRSWKWTTEGAAELPADYSLVKEDFENVDELWGPFVPTVQTQPYIHLAQKDLSANSKQIKNYVIDGQWSLKDATITAGTHMRTVPATLNFNVGQTYIIRFDYQLYREYRYGTDDDETYNLSALYPASYTGYNVPTEDGMYILNVRNADGEIIETLPLNASTFENKNYTYNSKASTELAEIVLSGDKITKEGVYITIDKKKADVTTIFVMDNLRIAKASGSGEAYTVPENQTVEYNGASSLPSVIEITFTDGQKLSVPVVYTGFDPTKAGTQTVTGTLQMPDNYYLTGSAKRTFTVNVTVKHLIKSFALPKDKKVNYNEEHGLPTQIEATLEDGSTVNLNVTYTGYDKTREGEQTVTGTVDTQGYTKGENLSNTFTVKVTVVKGNNLALTLGLSLGLGIPAVAGGGFAAYWFLIRKKKG